jgi:hypothetical protein
MWENRSSLSIAIHSIIGFIMLVVFLIIANVLVSSINNSTYSEIVIFLNSLLGLFFLLFLIGMINSLFWNFEFPLNLLAPISGGALGVLIVNLVYKILEFTQTFVYFDILEQILAYPITVIVFIVTIIIGYLIIINDENRRRERHTKEEVKKKEMKEKEKSFKSDISTKEVKNKSKKKPLRKKKKKR